jgi:hypothetical protein
VISAWGLWRGTLLGLGAFALAAHALLWLGAAVPPWLLFLCIGAGILAGGRGACAPLQRTAPRWLSLAAAAVVLAIACVLGYGAVATPPRSWDGIVAWGLKADALAAQATLAQPLFADPAVLHHCPDYPLLQPLCLASLARVFGAGPARALQPSLYVLLVAGVWVALRRRTGDGALSVWCALGVAVMPQLIGAGGGAVDSGYAETFHALALTAAAAALLLGDSFLLLAAAVLLPLVKPEGTVHAVLLAATALVWAPLPLCGAALGGAAASLAVVLPLQLQLAHAGPASPWLPTGVLLAAAVCYFARRALELRPPDRRVVTLAAGCAAAAVVALVLVAQPAFAGSGTVLFADYVGHFDRALERLPQTFAIASGLLATALSPRKFGLLWPLLAVLWWTRRRGATDRGVRGLAAFLVLSLLAVVAAFFLSPEPDLGHHLRSSAARLLLQLVGVGWLLCGVALSSRLDGAPLPAWLAKPLGR